MRFRDSTFTGAERVVEDDPPGPVRLLPRDDRAATRPVDQVAVVVDDQAPAGVRHGQSVALHLADDLDLHPRPEREERLGGAPDLVVAADGLTRRAA